MVDALGEAGLPPPSLEHGAAWGMEEEYEEEEEEEEEGEVGGWGLRKGNKRHESCDMFDDLRV